MSIWNLDDPSIDEMMKEISSEYQKQIWNH